MHKLGNYKVEWGHYYDKQKRNIVIAQVFDEENKLIAKGRSIKSDKDIQNKKIGRKVALQKALEKSKIEKSERAKIWEGYRTGMTKTPRW